MPTSPATDLLFGLTSFSDFSLSRPSSDFGKSLSDFADLSSSPDFGIRFSSNFGSVSLLSDFDMTPSLVDCLVMFSVVVVVVLFDTSPSKTTNT